MMETLKNIWFFICTWLTTSFAVFYLGIQGFIQMDKIPEQYDFLKNIVLMFAATVISIIINYFKFSLDTRKRLKETQTKIDGVANKTCLEIQELRKSLGKPKGGGVTADKFFETRSEDENFAETIKSKPKSIKYSGGNMDNLISGMMEAENFRNYIINNEDVKVQFLFPDPNNKDVIDYLVKHVTTGNIINTYKAGINNAVKLLCDFVKKNNLKDRVEYRFYNFVPSFGLKIIANGTDNRLYVDLYTIGIAKENRYRFKIEEKNSPNTYLVFKDQYEKLWDISSKKRKLNYLF